MVDTTGYDRMRRGEVYPNPDFHLIEMQAEARKKLDRLNAVPNSDMFNRTVMLRDQLGSFGGGMVMSPVTWEYGRHIHIGEGVFINFECVFLDGADVRIGNGSVIAPRVQFLTAGHPIDPEERALRDEAGRIVGGNAINRPITIGENVWIGANVLIMGGVSIGDGSTIGAGSVVTRDVPGGVVAAGNPCRVIRTIASKDNVKRSRAA
ncbi:sugar O-acetyltransferase [Devosia sp.]|uniref:sugar O-acetyltransferase n=1 Tax=Devosia sp. TaxID=1871048 RepID=UPI0025C538B8|nr:sugar O-acetyltransferase [Devosia sp.]